MRTDIEKDPDRILELYPDGCPTCKTSNLEALTWKSLNLPDVTVGCWNCDFIILPKNVKMKDGHYVLVEEANQ